jgi:hypothetical protein
MNGGREDKERTELFFFHLKRKTDDTGISRDWGHKGECVIKFF